MVRYAPFDAQFAKQILLTPLEKSYREPAKSEKQFSVQGTVWFAVTGPDYMKPGPWNTSIVINAHPAGKAFRLEALNHANSGVAVHWINEKLLFVQIWWGRISSTDLVFNAETGTFLYKEMASYVELMGPCN
ncbi:MAG TPA: hypothetical protein VH088_23775 [Terriglobales bacterium]|nr:hypothetical protein [Terriglobales bacterium]